MILNDGYGLENLPEEDLEANNKDIRNYLQPLYCKTLQVEQLTDVISCLLERSDLAVLGQIIHLHPSNICGKCSSNEHTIRSCHRIFSKPKSFV